MCRGSSLLNGVTPGVPPMRLSPHPRAKLLNGDGPPVVRRPRPSGALPSVRDQLGTGTRFLPEAFVPGRWRALKEMSRARVNGRPHSAGFALSLYRP